MQHPAFLTSDWASLSRLSLDANCGDVDVYKACAALANNNLVINEEVTLPDAARLLIQVRRLISRTDFGSAELMLDKKLDLDESHALYHLLEGDRICLQGLLYRRAYSDIERSRQKFAESAIYFAKHGCTHRSLRARVNAIVAENLSDSIFLGELVALEQLCLKEAHFDLVGTIKKARSVVLMNQGKFSQALMESREAVAAYQKDGCVEDREVALCLYAICTYICGDKDKAVASFQRISGETPKVKDFQKIFRDIAKGWTPQIAEGHPLEGTPWPRPQIRAKSIPSLIIKSLSEGPRTPDDLIKDVWGNNSYHPSLRNRLYVAISKIRKSREQFISFDGHRYEITSAGPVKNLLAVICLAISLPAWATFSAPLPVKLFSSYHLRQDIQLRGNSLPNSFVGCTLQAVKVGDSCRIVGSLHCSDDGFRHAILDLGIGNDIIPVKIEELNSNRHLDLVQYHWPQNNLSLETVCRQLAPIDNRIMNFNPSVAFNTKSLRATGYINGALQTEYSANEEWEHTRWPSRLTLFNWGPVQWIEANFIQIFQGMSGGVVDTADGQILGVIAALVPRQDRSIFVPYREVYNFLVEGNLRNIVDRQSLGRKATIQAAGDNIFKKGGGNGHTKGSLGNVEKKQSPDSILKEVTEPNEGVVIGDKILLGNSGQQCDGDDDLYTITEKMKLTPATGIYRDNHEDSLPPLSVRAGIMGRLKGFFSDTKQDRDSRHLIYLPIKSHPSGWRLLQTGMGNMLMDIREDEILFASLQHPFYQRGNVSGRKPIENLMRNMEIAQFMRLKVIPNADYSIITLKGEGLQVNSFNRRETGEKQTWTCRNQHYLKLICHPQDDRAASFSLSRRNQRDARISFRYSFLTGNTESLYFFQYFYGVLSEFAKPNNILDQMRVNFPIVIGANDRLMEQQGRSGEIAQMEQQLRDGPSDPNPELLESMGDRYKKKNKQKQKEPPNERKSFFDRLLRRN